MLEALELASPGGSPPDSPRPPPPAYPPPPVAFTRTGSASSPGPEGHANATLNLQPGPVPETSPTSGGAGLEKSTIFSRTMTSAVAAAAMSSSSSSMARSPIRDTAVQRALDPSLGETRDHINNNALVDAQVRLSRAKGRYQEHFSHFQRLLDTPASPARGYLSRPLPSAARTLSIPTPAPSSTGNATSPAPRRPAQWVDHAAAIEANDPSLGRDEQHTSRKYTKAPQPLASTSSMSATSFAPVNMQPVPTPTASGTAVAAQDISGAFPHIPPPALLQSQAAHPVPPLPATLAPVENHVHGLLKSHSLLQTGAPIQQAPGAEWSMEELKTMSSEVKDHVILRQQRQIQELTEQNQFILASAEKLLAEQQEIQEQRMRNARERDLLLTRERDARDQRLSETIIALREELDKARYAEKNFERVCSELNNERRHLRFALGKLSELQKKSEPLTHLLA